MTIDYDIHKEYADGGRRPYGVLSFFPYWWWRVLCWWDRQKKRRQKCCGTCEYWRQGVARNGACGSCCCPLPSSIWVAQDTIRWDATLPNSNTQCPVWKPKKK